MMDKTHGSNDHLLLEEPDEDQYEVTFEHTKTRSLAKEHTVEENLLHREREVKIKHNKK